MRFDDVGTACHLSGSADFHERAQTSSHQSVVHQHQALGQRHAHVVLELHRTCAGAAFGTVHDDEVGRDTAFDHRLADSEEFTTRADTQFHPDRLASRQFSQGRDEIDQFDRGAERGVRGWRNHGLADGYPAGFSDFGGDLDSGKHATQPGFRTLRELDRNGLHLIESGTLGKTVRIESAVLGPASEVFPRRFPRSDRRRVCGDNGLIAPSPVS